MPIFSVWVFLKLAGDLTSPSPLPQSRWADSLESCLRPCLLSSPSLSFSPFSHFTHLQPDGLLTGVTSSKTSSFAPRRQEAWCLGTSLPSWSQLQRRERQWQRAYRRRLTPLRTQDKTTETETRSTLATAYACTFQFPAKLGFQLIKLELYPLVHTYTANYVRVHCRHLGYIKRVE